MFFTSCLKNVEPQQHYMFVIPQGQHSSINTIKKYNENLLTFAFRFDETGRYDLGDLDQIDTNKLIGFRFGIDPHQNSFRFGWRWSTEDEYMIIVAYSYVDGVRDIYDIGYCFLNQIYSGEIEETEENIIYRFQGAEYVISKSTKKTKQKYFLFPYFGGNKKAPHNINIELWF